MTRPVHVYMSIYIHIHSFVYTNKTKEGVYMQEAQTGVGKYKLY